MTTDQATSTGTRRSRLSDQQTADRMISAATGMIQESGLTVSLEHISVEEVIRRADVSRTSAYRRWPHRGDFFADLLRALARDPVLRIGSEERQSELSATLEAHLDWLETADGRARLYREAVRIGGSADLRMLATSNLWRSYIALQAAVLSAPDDAFRAELTAHLAASERQTHERLARNYAMLATLFGFRLRADARIGFDDIAVLCSSLMNGVAIKAQSDAGLLSRTAGAPGLPSEQWTLPAIGCYAIQLQYLEPDPDVHWNGERIAEVRNLLRLAATGRTPLVASLERLG